jgi:type IV secretory pathway VirJ component
VSKAVSRWIALLCAAAALASAPLAAQEKLSHGRFRNVTLYRPQGDVKQVVLFLSGDNGWDGAVLPMTQALVARGAMVAGIDTPQLF